MSKTLKITICIVVIILIVAGVWGWYAYSQNSAKNRAINSYNQKHNITNSYVQLKTSPNDTSDNALDSDLSTIDAQMQNLNADSSRVDSSLLNQ